MSLTKERSIFEILKKKTPGTVAFFDKGVINILIIFYY